jgi:hypothetical protein
MMEANMDGATGGPMGDVGGTVLDCFGAYVGARESKRAAINRARQLFYRRIFDLMVAFEVVLLAIVSLAAADILPYLVYIAAMIVWFMLLGPAIFWTNRRMQELQIQTRSFEL